MQRLKGLSLPTFGSNGTSESTSPPLDVNLLEAVETRRALVSSLVSAVTVYHSTAAKLRPDPHRSIGGSSETALPLEWLSREMLAGEDAIESLGELPDGYAPFARTLRLVGKVQSAVGALNQAFLDSVGASVLQELERSLRDFKDYERKSKEADKLRSVLEAKLREKKSPDADAQRVAEVDYNDVCDTLDRLARNLVQGIDRDRRVLEELLSAQLDHVTKQAEVLRACKASLEAGRPILPPRSSASLGVPTRMARSHSESAVRLPNRLSSPSRSPEVSGSTTPTGRRSTVGASSAGSADKVKTGRAEVIKNRSRSGSMLGRFAPSAILDRRKKDKASEYDDEDNSEADREQHEDSELEGPDEPTAAAASSPSRFTSGLPTLGSFKNLSIGTNIPKNYGSLADDVASPSSVNSTSSSSRPAPLKRHQTAPALQTTSSNGQSSSSRRLVEAKWRFDASDSGELTLEKGDVVEVEEEINSEWMTGRIVSTSEDGFGKSRVGRRGMFPTAFVAASISTLSSSSYDFSRPSRRSIDQDGDGWSMSAASNTDESANELSEDEAAKEGLRGAGTRSGTGTPRKAAPPPPARRRTGTIGASASPFAD